MYQGRHLTLVTHLFHIICSKKLRNFPYVTELVWTARSGQQYCRPGLREVCSEYPGRFERGAPPGKAGRGIEGGAGECEHLEDQA
jgi:hypothetical protein